MYKELAKFCAGVTAWESIVHASFALSGILPFKLFGIPITRKLNRVQIILPALTSACLIYVGWFKKPGEAAKADPAFTTKRVLPASLLPIILDRVISGADIH